MSRFLAVAFLVLVMPVTASSQDPVPQPAPKVDKTKELQKQVTTFRGLEFTQPVNVGEYSREELQAFIRKELDRELPKDEAEKIRKGLLHFGLIPADLDLYKTVVDLLGSSIAGFYHPKTKELRLIKMAPGEPAEDELSRDITLIHELTHAAQDQNFDLNTLPIELKTNDDLVLAVQGLVEGDATVVGLKWGLKDQFEFYSKEMFASYKAGNLGEEVKNVPACLRKSLGFPYGHGSEFILALLSRSKDDWSAISKVYADLPSSSEQIMHPQKYFGEARDYPQDISIDGLEGIVADGWKSVNHNVHGEFGVKLVLDEFKVDTARSRRMAAEGWDGDRFFIFDNAKGAIAGVWMTAWDSEDDAKEFHAAYALALEAKHEGAVRETADQKVTFTKGDTKTVLERRGAEVLVMDGFGEAAAGRINKIWSSVKKAEIRKVDRVAPKAK